jgi:hypothetical protein
VTSSLKRTSMTVQGSSQCLPVTVTTTVSPSMRYSPLTISCEKRPDLSSPTKVAPFSLAVLRALASSVEGETLVATPKVRAISLFRLLGWDALTLIPCDPSSRGVPPVFPPNSRGYPTWLPPVLEDRDTVLGSVPCALLPQTLERRAGSGPRAALATRHPASRPWSYSNLPSVARLRPRSIRCPWSIARNDALERR